MKKKTLALIITFAAAAVLTMSGFIFKFSSQAAQYSRDINNNYQHAFAELVNGVGEIDTSLQKSLYATSPSMISAVCTDVYGKALSAEMAMGELPFASYDLERTADFISLVGDYAYALSRSAACGNTYTDEQYTNLSALSDSAALLARNLNAMLADINSGALTIGEINNSSKTLNYVQEEAVSANLGESFKQMESEFPEVPSLIYDGPFSESITNMSSKMLEGLSDASPEQAISAAADMTGIAESGLTCTGERDGAIPVYVISGKSNGGDVTVEVTRKGGIVTEVNNSRMVEKALIGAEDAVKLAERYLQEHGYTSMQTSYYMAQGNRLTVNFAYKQEDVICYTDLVKVTVALDNGSISGFESRGYVMNHHDRDIPSPAVGEEDAAGAVSKNLKILSRDLAVIPNAGMDEVLCYEYKCESEDGKHYIVYVNADTGDQEKILILLEDESGTLTI